MTVGPAVDRNAGRTNRFDVDHLSDRLGRRVVSGSIISFGAQFVRILLGLLSIAILARLVPPAEFGVVALVLPISYLASEIAQYALGQVTVQRQRITQAQVSGLFWANLAISGAVTAILMLASWLVAAFYSDPRLGPILMALALSTLLAGAASQFSAILSREMRFWAVQGSAITAEVVSIACAVWAAYAGLSYWAIVIQILVRQSVLLVMRVALARWWPHGPSTLRHARGLISMGGDLAVFSLCTQLGQGLGIVMVGRVLGEVQAGLFLRAMNVANWPITQLMGPLGTVLTPALSRVANDPGRFEAAFERVVIQTAIIAVPLSAIFIALAEPVTLILLGAQWRDATAILAMLGLLAFATPLSSVVNWRLIATGSTALLRRVAWIALLLALSGYAVGVQFGPIMTACIQGVLSLAVFMPMKVWMAHKRGCMRFGAFIRTVLPFVMSLTAIALTVGLGYRAFAPDMAAGDLPFALGVGVAAIGGLHFAFCLAVPRYRRELLDIGGKLLAFAR